MNKRIAIIPARGGSKRLPRKNILPIGNEPMIAYPIRTAQQSGLFSRIIVSTEDAQIADIAAGYGADIHHRPPKLAQDHSTMAQVCLHVLEHNPCDVFCCLYATAVLLRAETLVASETMLYKNPEANYVMGVSEFNYPPPQALQKDEHGFLSYWQPEFLKMQSQFYPELTVSNGTFIWARTDAFIQDGFFYGSKLRGYLVNPEEVIDIDTPEDYALAKHLHAQLHG
jgi:N-acylneuraminate cytidylyltransferase